MTLKWFIAYSATDTQESDMKEVAALFDADDMLNEWPFPVRATSKEDAAGIAAEWVALGPFDDVGDLTIARNARTCWLARI